MESMTGYAFFEKACNQFTFSVELKSLNNKYLETYVNLPKVMKRSENELHKKLKNSFERGKLELSIDIYDWVNNKQATLNEEAIRKYYGHLKRIHSSLKIDSPLVLDAILLLDGIIQRERSQLSGSSQREIDRAVAMVIRKAREMRIAEGRTIEADIRRSLREIALRAGRIKTLASESLKNKRDLLVKRIETLAVKTVNEDRMYTEVAILADKLDINEELVRLGDHLGKFRKTMGEKEQIGRKLDFLAQEIFREVNTIGSKSNSSEIAHHVVEMKNHIDKIREHCRNIV
ncbi:MAG: YicC family protein [Spirochaetes bacterium]|nr:YicC family protein [Spirochaetota bacterium]